MNNMQQRTLVFSIAVCTFLLLSLSCGKGRGDMLSQEEGDTLAFRYASHLRLIEYPYYTKVLVRNPWDTLRVLQTYILLPQDASIGTDKLPEGTVVRVPLSRSVVYTSVHCGLLEELGRLSAIAGVCDASYIYSAAVKAGVAQGDILDLGNSASPDVERIIDLHPDAMLLSPFENSGGYGRIDRLGIPLIECADYMETSALGRAEWMRFYGRLFGCGERADSLFDAVEQHYLKWKNMALMAEERPTVFTDLPMGTVWYVPGGGSTTGGMYADAGAHYLFAGNRHSGSVPHAFETIYEKAQHADYWLIRYHASEDKTYRSLQAEHDWYPRFKAHQERRIYGCNTATSTFYEEVPFHPDRLLAELVRIFHPSLRGDSAEWKFYVPLQ